jgi:hypothetical protein
MDCIYFDVWLQDDIEVEVAPEQEMPVVARFWDIFAWKDLFVEDILEERRAKSQMVPLDRSNQRSGIMVNFLKQAVDIA